MRPSAQEEIDALEDSEAAQAELDALFEPYHLPEAEAMLTSIQAFDPPGVAARDLRESILIQLRMLGRPIL